MRLVTESHSISLDEIRTLAQGRFGDMIKGVVDLERGILVLDADLHSDQEAELLAGGSKQGGSISTLTSPERTGWNSIP